MQGWKQYHPLSKEEIQLLQEELFKHEPKYEYPHYEPIKTNPKDESYIAIKLSENTVVEVNRFGDIKYKEKIVRPYATGSFMHVAMVHLDEYGAIPVYELVKQAFDPIDNRNLYEIHHINNNALDNRPENLIYVTKKEHRLIDNDFNKKKLIPISRTITQNNRNEITNFFNENSERNISGSELLNYFNHTSFYRIKYNIEKLCKDNFIIRIENHNLFIFQKFKLNINR